MKKNRNITDLYSRNVLFTVFITLLFLAVYWSFKEYFRYKEADEKLKEEYINKQKKDIKRRTEKVVDFIEFTNSYVQESVKKDLKEQVYHVYNIANSIYIQNKGVLSDREIKQLILKNLRNYQTNSKQGNLVITSLNGMNLLYLPNPELEGKNWIDFEDINGDYTIKQEINLINNKKEGFIDGSWLHYSEIKQSDYQKVSYIKIFEPFDWYFSFGDYHSNIISETKKIILEKLKAAKFQKETPIYIISFNGQAELINSPNYSNGDLIWDIKDPDGIEIVKNELHIARQEEGDYTYYKWAFVDNVYSEAVAYVKGIHSFNWIVGTRINLEKSSVLIPELKKQLFNAHVKRIIELLIILLVIIISIIIVTIQTKKYILNEFSVYKQILKESLIQQKSIRFSRFKYDEFKQLALTTNTILKTAKHAKKELHKTEDRFQTILENVPVMICSIKKNSTLNIWNKECEKTLLYSYSEVRNHPNPISLFYNEEYSELVMSHVQKTDGVFRLYKLKTRDGSERFQKWAFMKDKGENTICVGYDVTEIINKENELIENQTFLSEILNNIPSPVFFKGLDLSYSGCNNKFCELMGKCEADIVSKSVFEIVPMENAEVYHKMDLELLEKGGFQVYEAKVIAADKKLYNYLFTKSIMYDHKGKKSGIIGVMQDISNIREAENKILMEQEKLRMLNATKDRFFSIIAHDLRNPFNAILGLTKRLNQNIKSFNLDVILEYIQIIHKSTEQTSILLENLLSWASTQTKSLTPELKDNRITDLVNQTINVLLESANVKKIVLNNKIYDDFHVLADANMVLTILRNIIGNAIKFTPEEGQITITAQIKGECVDIMIKDTGVGMTSEIINNLFKVDQIVQTKGTNEEVGSGLGLVLCKELIDLNNGKISIESEENKGSSFIVSLPVSKAN